MTPVIKSQETIKQIKQLQDELKEMAHSLMTFPTKSKQNRMQKIDDALSWHWRNLHTLYPEITSEDITDYENLPSRSMDATVGAKIHKSYSSVFSNPDKSLIQDDLDKLRRLNDGTIQKNDMNQLQDYLNQFKDGKLAIRVDSSLAYSALTEILDKYDISLIADSEFPDHLYQRPYVVVDEDAYVYSYKNMDEAYQFQNISDSVDISELECLDMLQDFKDGKLVVQLINGYQYEKFISYLKENGIAIRSKTEYTQNPSHFPYFYMLRPGVLTAGESYEAIKNYIHINKLVPLGVFMPAFEKTMKEANKAKEIQPNAFDEQQAELVPDSIEFSIKPINDKPELDYKVLYEQVKAERDIAFSQLEALGTSFGEKEDAAKERIEGNTLHHLDSLLDRKKEEIIFRLNHAHDSKDQSAVLMDEIKKASLETAEWLKQERTAKSMATSFENADAMLDVLNHGTALYNLDNGKYVWLYSENGDVAVDNINALTANKIAKEAVEQNEYWEAFLSAGAQIYTKEEIKNFCEENYSDTWITTEDYEKTLGLPRDMEQNKDSIERD